MSKLTVEDLRDVKEFSKDEMTGIVGGAGPAVWAAGVVVGYLATKALDKGWDDMKVWDKWIKKQGMTEDEAGDTLKKVGVIQ